MIQDEFADLLKLHPSALNNRQAFTKLIKEFFPDQPLQRNLIISAHKIGIAAEIQSAETINNAFALRFVKRLTDEQGISRKNADWAVSFWCVCYGKIVLQKPCSIQISEADKTGKPTITEEQKGNRQYQDLFQYAQCENRDVYAVTGYFGEKEETIILQNRYHGKTVSEIAESAFRGSPVREAVFTEGYTRIGEKAFENCICLTQVILPLSLKEIGNFAFCGCRKLASIALSPKLQLIGTFAFSSTGLKHIKFPTSLIQIDPYAFSDCKDLFEVTIPKTVVHIPDGCFKGCTSLAKVHLSDTTAAIGKEAFMGAETLMTIQIPETVQQIGENAFWGTNPKMVLLCKSGSLAEQYARGYKINYQLI